jgi:hypothetical protein
MHPSSNLALHIAADYMLFIGIVGLVWPFFGLRTNYPGAREKSRASRAGAYTRGALLSGASVAAGIGLFCHDSWGRTLALVLLVIDAAYLYSANEIAWACSVGKPTPRTRLISILAVAAWDGAWFFAIYRLVL